ncbi:hypothetical protein TELCIR_25565, partial [Teladorsagia circumcincta]
RSLCLNATSTLAVDIIDSDDDLSPTSNQKKMCLCASINTTEIIGIGESGKVMACYNKDTNEKYALKVLRDGPKARREVSLHYLTK